MNNAKSDQDFQYDIVTGVSAGSINALGVLMYEKGDEKNMADFLTQTWMVTNKSNICVTWPGGYIQGIFFKPSLFDNNPELPYLQGRVFTEPTKRKGVIVTTDIKTATKVAFTEKDWAEDKNIAAYAALFSSAIPFAFLYRDYGNYTFIDGGWSESMDVEDAVLRCREEVEDDSDIIVDVVWCFNHTLTMGDTSGYNGLQMWSRAKDIQKWRTGTFIYNYTVQAFPDVNWRYAMIPSHKPPFEILPLEFNDKKTQTMINTGESDALNALNEGENISHERMLKYSQKFIDNTFYNKR